MPQLTYTYDPGQIGTSKKDRMRFELGDTAVEGGAETCALSDEEINAVLSLYPNRWKMAKFKLVESVYMRFASEIDTRVGPLSLNLQDRADHWKKLYDDMKKEVSGLAAPSVNPSALGEGAVDGGHYFYSGMMSNPRTGLPE